METSGNAVEKFLNVKAAAAADSTTKTIQKMGLRSMLGFYTFVRFSNIPLVCEEGNILSSLSAP